MSTLGVRPFDTSDGAENAVHGRVQEAFAGERADLLFTNLSNEQEQTLREASAE